METEAKPESDSTGSELLERVKKLEEENQVMKIGGLVAFGLAIAALVVGLNTEAPPEAASKLIARDTLGIFRVVAGAKDTGVAGLDVMNGMGKKQVGFSVTGDGRSGLVMGDLEGKPRIVMSVAKDGSAGIALKDAGGITRVSLAVSSDGTPGINFFNKEGKRLVPSGRKKKAPEKTATPKSDNGETKVGTKTTDAEGDATPKDSEKPKNK